MKKNASRKWTREAFQVFDAENPRIWEMFCKFALQAAARRPHYSAKAIFHRVRWETMVAGNGDFKIDDGWISHYSRKFMKEYPLYKDFFETRDRRNSYHNDVNGDLLC